MMPHEEITTPVFGSFCVAYRHGRLNALGRSSFYCTNFLYAVIRGCNPYYR